ncbi:hypothetical protein PS15m_010541 [Mucor circinelloides]
MLKLASLIILGVFFSAVVSAVANEHVQILADEPISIVPGPDGHDVIPVVQTVDGVVTTFYYTIIGQQTIVDGGESRSIDGVDDDLTDYPNIASAMKNMDVFEDMLARIVEQNPEFGMMIASESEQASASVSASS